MQRIFIDITNLLMTRFLSGIQRVVRNLSLEMIKTMPERLVFIAYDNDDNCFKSIQTKDFEKYLKTGFNDFSEEPVTDMTFKPGDIFFDLDSIWNNKYKRNHLYPKLKSLGVRVAVYIYDIIPITHPQYCDNNTAINFLIYFGAVLNYADMIITSAQSTIDVINNFCEKNNIKKVPCYVSWLGSDFKGAIEYSDNEIDERLEVLKGKKFILAVGTIEPRKNHKFLMDAFEKGLYEEDLCLVFAGRAGWKVEDLVERMNNAPEKGKQFFWFTGLNDQSIDWLYRHAFMVGFPTYNEGFGLPIIEALERGTPVMASNIPVIREVGRDYCKYFDLDNAENAAAIVKSALNNPDEYKAWVDKVKEYKAFTWKDTSDKILEILDKLSFKNERTVKTNVKQMVILTARDDAIGATLRYIDAWMPFIQEVVLLCPPFAEEAMKHCYSGRIKIITITDDQLLQGKELPEEHGKRNFFLRCLAMKRPELDDVFIMSDDDYRPLRHIDESVFIKDGKYRAYYFYDTNAWKGAVGKMSSYDHMQFVTREFLNENQYPTRQYSSHQPQIIEKEIYCEVIDKFPGIEKEGIDEWSFYFNYLEYKYPEIVSSEPYVTMSWPGTVADWPLMIYPKEYLFENYYEQLYKENSLFDGFSKGFNENAKEEAEAKIALVSTAQERKKAGADLQDECRARYEAETGRLYEIDISANDVINISIPKELKIKIGSYSFLQIYAETDFEKIEISYRIEDMAGNLIGFNDPRVFPKEDLKLIGNRTHYLIWAVANVIPEQEYKFTIIVDADGCRQSGSVPVYFEQ